MNDKMQSNLGDGDQRSERPARDLVETLRFMSHSMGLATAPVCKEAADEIERLREKLSIAEGCSALSGIGVNANQAALRTAKKFAADAERLRAALQNIAMQQKTDETDEEGDFEHGYDTIIEVARVALAPQHSDDRTNASQDGGLT